MSEIDAVEDSEPSWEDTPLTPNRIGAIAGAWDLVVFPVVTYVVFEEIVTGLVAGALVGVGMFLFLPYAMRSNESSESGGQTVGGGQQIRRFNRGAAGFAVSVSGMLFLTWRFATDEWLLGLAGVPVVAFVGYVVLSTILP